MSSHINGHVLENDSHYKRQDVYEFCEIASRDINYIWIIGRPCPSPVPLAKWKKYI